MEIKLELGSINELLTDTHKKQLQHKIGEAISKINTDELAQRIADNIDTSEIIEYIIDEIDYSDLGRRLKITLK